MDTNGFAIPPWYFDELTVVNVARIVIASIAIVGHTFIIHLFIRFGKLRKTQYNHLVLMLVFSDLLLAIGVLVRGIYAAYATQQGIRQFPAAACLFINQVLQGAGMNCSQMAVLGIMIDRFSAIYQPIIYSKRLNMFLFKIIVIIAIFYASTSIFLAYFNNTSALIPVCSAGQAQGSSSSYFSLTAGSLITSMLCLIYVSTLYLLYRYKKNRNSQLHNALKFHRKVFVSASLILLCYSIFWVGPFAFNVLSLIFHYDKDTRSYISVAVGFGNALNAGCSVFVYLFKYPVINECAQAVLCRKINHKINYIFSAHNNARMTESLGLSLK